MNREDNSEIEQIIDEMTRHYQDPKLNAFNDDLTVEVVKEKRTRLYVKHPVKPLLTTFRFN